METIPAHGGSLVNRELTGVERETLLERVQLGAKLAIRASPEAKPIEGIVSEIAPAADPATRTFPVKIDLPSDAGLRAGRFARAGVPLGESRMLSVPATAVEQRGQMEVIFVAAHQRAQLRLVKTGKKLGDEIEILSGLNSGERVIIEGVAGLHDGQTIELKP